MLDFGVASSKKHAYLSSFKKNKNNFGIQKLYNPNKVQLNVFTLVGNDLNFSFCRPSDNQLIRTSSENMQTTRTSPKSIVGNLGKPANLYFIIG